MRRLHCRRNEGEDRVRASYRDNDDRLAQIKSEYNPENVFRVNQNIRPRGDVGWKPIAGRWREEET
jgi:hypothetical protein